jgi:hypothetical protein
VEDSDEGRMAHLLFNHPMELLQSKKVQRGIFKLAEDAGGFLADLLRGKNAS